jgi:hypothetical protein
VSRVAVHLPPGHPHGLPDEPVVFAYRLGRIRDGQDNLLIHSGETIPLDVLIGGLVKQAKAEYPEKGVEVKLERLVDNGDDTASWIDAEQFDPEQHTPAGAGTGAARAIHVDAGQEV